MSENTTPAAETVDAKATVSKKYLVVRIPLPSKKTLAVAGASIAATAAVVATVVKLKETGSEDEAGFEIVTDDDASDEESLA